MRKMEDVEVNLSRDDFLSKTSEREDLEPGFSTCFTDEINKMVIDSVLAGLASKLCQPDETLTFKDARVVKIGGDQIFAKVFLKNGEASSQGA